MIRWQNPSSGTYQGKSIDCVVFYPAYSKCAVSAQRSFFFAGCNSFFIVIIHHFNQCGKYRRLQALNAMMWKVMDPFSVPNTGTQRRMHFVYPACMRSDAA